MSPDRLPVSRGPYRRPRVLGALWFGVAGVLMSTLMYGIPVTGHGWLVRIQFFALPAMSGAVAGALLGFRILASRTTQTFSAAAVLGLASSALSLMVFAPLFALANYLAGDTTTMLGPIVLVLAAGIVAVGPLLIFAGATAGILLRQTDLFFRRRCGRP